MIGLYFRNIFLISDVVPLWSRGFTIFQGRIQNNCYQNVKWQIHVKIASFKKISRTI